MRKPKEHLRDVLENLKNDDIRIFVSYQGVRLNFLITQHKDPLSMS